MCDVMFMIPPLITTKPPPNHHPNHHQINPFFTTGAFAVITLMVGKVVDEFATFPNTTEPLPLNTTIATTTLATTIDGEPVYTPIEVATIVCFMVGFWNVSMSYIKLIIFIN